MDNKSTFVVRQWNIVSEILDSGVYMLKHVNIHPV